jgi:hypothetical protein
MRLAKLLAIYLDPDCTFWSSLENKPRSAISGMIQKLYGVKSGLPDVQVIYRGEAGLRVIFIELKSRVASASQVQKQLLSAGAERRLARSRCDGGTASFRCGVSAQMVYAAASTSGKTAASLEVEPS